jgi:hypothetical protein
VCILHIQAYTSHTNVYFTGVHLIGVRLIGVHVAESLSDLMLSERF